MSQKTVAACAVVALAIACGGGVESGDAESNDVTASAALYTVARDERRCPAPACGGYLVSAVGSTAAPEYVTTLDLSASGLDAAAQQSVLNAPGEELLLHARLGAVDKRGFRALAVKGAYRGLPGVVPAARDVLYSVAERVPGNQCTAAPCNNEIATRLSDSKASAVTRVVATRASKTAVDAAWLSNRIVSHGALVSAHSAAGQRLPAGVESLLDASQVWLRLADLQPSCPAVREAACGAGEVHAYRRTDERCLVPLGCVKQQACTQMTMACAEGYTRVAWTGAQGGCQEYACDPTWSVQ